MAEPGRESDQRQKARVLLVADDGGKLVISSNILFLAICTAPNAVYGWGWGKQRTKLFPKLAPFTLSKITVSYSFSVLYHWQVFAQPWDINRKRGYIVLKMRKFRCREAQIRASNIPNPGLLTCSSLLALCTILSQMSSCTGSFHLCLSQLQFLCSQNGTVSNTFLFKFALRTKLGNVYRVFHIVGIRQF